MKQGILPIPVIFPHTLNNSNILVSMIDVICSKLCVLVGLEHSVFDGFHNRKSMHFMLTLNTLTKLY